MRTKFDGYIDIDWLLGYILKWVVFQIYCLIDNKFTICNEKGSFCDRPLYDNLDYQRKTRIYNCIMHMVRNIYLAMGLRRLLQNKWSLIRNCSQLVFKLNDGNIPHKRDSHLRHLLMIHPTQPDDNSFLGGCTLRELLFILYR
jgi:hypothetical protein